MWYFLHFCAKIGTDKQVAYTYHLSVITDKPLKSLKETQHIGRPLYKFVDFVSFLTASNVVGAVLRKGKLLLLLLGILNTFQKYFE